MFILLLFSSILSMLVHVECSVFSVQHSVHMPQNLIEKIEKFRGWKEIYANNIQSYHGCINMLYTDL